MSTEEDQRAAVLTDITDYVKRHGSGDAALEGAIDWLDRHPTPSPAEINAVGELLVHTWHNHYLGPSDMGIDLWVQSFRRVGFYSDTGRTPPRRSLVIYRGATEETRLRMAWSTSRVVAEGHVRATIQVGNRPEQLIDPDRRLWRAVVPPQGILARIERLREEREVIVDPAHLRSVEEVPLDPWP